MCRSAWAAAGVKGCRHCAAVSDRHRTGRLWYRVDLRAGAASVPQPDTCCRAVRWQFHASHTDIRDQSRIGRHHRCTLQRPRRRRRRDRLARVHAHAADRCRRAQAGPGERRDLGSVARAAHPGRSVPGRSAANGLGSALDGRSHIDELRVRAAAAGDGQHLAGDHAARGLEQHHSGCVRSGEQGQCDAVGRRVGNSRHAHHDCRGSCLHARPVDGP